MSKAFTKEGDDDGAPELPDREISSFPNLVSLRGLALIEAEIARYSAANAVALSRSDKEASARASRELRYWTARRNTAQIQPAPAGSGEVTFGSAVNILREDGLRSSFRIVGEDEADPARGSVSYVSPLAKALLGKVVGDVALVAGSEVEIEAVGP